MDQPVIPIILKALALAMGAAVVVLGILGSGSVQTNQILLGLGLFSLALWALQKS